MFKIFDRFPRKYVKVREKLEHVINLSGGVYVEL
jgi:hypothetical protein